MNHWPPMWPFCLSPLFFIGLSSNRKRFGIRTLKDDGAGFHCAIYSFEGKMGLIFDGFLPENPAFKKNNFTRLFLYLLTTFSIWLWPWRCIVNVVQRLFFSIIKNFNERKESANISALRKIDYEKEQLAFVLFIFDCRYGCSPHGTSWVPGSIP